MLADEPRAHFFHVFFSSKKQASFHHRIYTKSFQPTNQSIKSADEMTYCTYTHTHTHIHTHTHTQRERGVKKHGRERERERERSEKAW